MKLITILAIGLFFTGCATSYQKVGFSGGYWEKQLREDMYEVGFSGNGYTSSDTVNQYFKRRCSELTLESGYDYFLLVNEDSSTSFHSTGTTTSGTVYNNGNFVATSNNGGFNKSKSRGYIKMFKKGQEPPMAIDPRIYLKSFKD